MKRVLLKGTFFYSPMLPIGYLLCIMMFIDNKERWPEDLRYRKVIRKKEQKKKKILISIGLLFILLGIFLFAYSKVFSYEHVEIDKSDETLGIEKSEEVPVPVVVEKEQEEKEVNPYENKVVHIGLFGLDRRDSSDKNSRSDSMMIATVDFKHHKLKLTSLMRDQAIYIEDRGMDKLNHAYAYGQAPLALKTINQNFGLDVREYVTVDFYMLEDVIDAMGGVEIDVKEKEIPLINAHMKDVKGSKEKDIKNISKAGLQDLNGAQAVSYARIRYVGNGDFERTERQQSVLKALLTEVKEANVFELTKLITKVLPYMETSLDKETILSLGKAFLGEKDLFAWEQMRYPLDGTWVADHMDNGAWMMRVDLEEQKKSIQNYLYEDIHPINKKEVDIFDQYRKER